MRRAGVFVLLLFAIPPGAAGAAGKIHGTLWTSAGERARFAHQTPQKRRFFSLFRGGSKPAAVRPVPASAAADFRDVVISVRRLSPDAARRLAEDARRERDRAAPVIDLPDGRLEPRVLAVAAGDRVEFRNRGRLWHGAFSVAAARKFDLGKLRPGAASAVTFDRPGVVPVQCDLHPEEIGYVNVLPHRAFAQPDEHGRFVLPRLQAGSYQLVVWHPRRGLRTQRVEIPKRGDVKCDLVL